MTWKEWGLWVGVFVAAGICVLVLRHRRNEKSDPYGATPNGGNVKGSTNTIWIAMATVAVLRVGVPLVAYGLGAVFEQGILGCQSNRCALGCYKLSRDWPLKKEPYGKVVEKCKVLEKKVQEPAEKGCHN